MQVTFNSQERTLRELVTLAASAGWKVTKVTRTPGSLFGYLVAVPVPIPDLKTINDSPSVLYESGSSASLLSSGVKTDVCEEENHSVEHGQQMHREDLEVIERASSRCGTPTFGSNMKLSSVQEALARFGGGIIRRSRMAKIVTLTGSNPSVYKEPPPVPLKPALTLSSGSGGNAKKKAKPSPLSVVTLQGSPGPSPYTPLSATTPTGRGRRLSSTSPKQEFTQAHGQLYSYPHPQIQPHSPGPPPKKVPRRLSLANLRPTASHSQQAPPLPTFTFTRQPLGSPRSPKGLDPVSPVSALRRRESHAQLSHAEMVGATDAQTNQVHTQGFLAPSFIPIRAGNSQGGIVGGISLVPPVSPQRTIPRRSSYVQLSQPPSRMRSGTVAGISSRPFPVIQSSSSNQLKELGVGMSSDYRLPCSPADELASHVVPEFGSGNVMATAAKFEKGEFV